MFRPAPGAPEGARVAAHYLLKTEPSEYSFADLLRDKETLWEGVSNPVALRNLRAMTAGDLLVIYETGKVKSAVGAASVISVQGADAPEPRVRIKAAKLLPQAVPLAQIKANRLFSDSPLVRQGRLSVVPLSKEQYRYLCGE
jgi:predicted RNA-binding protein with PUA-like domain